MADLTVSAIDRQNILNNKYAIQAIESHLDFGGLTFENELVFTKQQLASLYEVSNATIARYIAENEGELKGNGYRVLRGEKLRRFKELHPGLLTDEKTKKTTVLGIFSFRAVLNLGMLLTESEPARHMRHKILDIAIDVISAKSGGHSKYINQRDGDFLAASFQEESYRTKFTSALKNYVVDSPWKYARFTNLIYQEIFEENAKEYKAILRLSESEKIRDTMYSEILDLISSYESGLSSEIEQESLRLCRRLSLQETETLIKKFSSHALFTPFKINARTKMASRDLCFRDALHEKLNAYIKAVPESDFEKFIGEKSKSLEEQISSPELLAVFKRLKDR